MKFRRAAKPQAYPLRYVEDFGAKYNFVRLSALNGCGSIGCMLHISDRGKTAWVLPLSEIFANPPMASATARFMTFASASTDNVSEKLCALWNVLRENLE